MEKVIPVAREIPWEFKTWLSNFIDVDLPIGDLAKDVLRDPDFPDSDEYYETLDHIARKSHYDHVIIDTFRTVWDFYKSST